MTLFYVVAVVLWGGLVHFFFVEPWLAKRGRERVIDPSLGDAPTRPPDPEGYRLKSVEGKTW